MDSNDSWDKCLSWTPHRKQSLLQKMMQTNQLSLYNKDIVILLSKGLVLELCLSVSSFIC